MGIEPETTLQQITDSLPEIGSNEFHPVSRVALLGRDYRGINFELLCNEGDQVKAGSPLMRDARRPQIVFTAPASGVVTRLELGKRRKLVSLQIDLDTSEDSHYFELTGTQNKASLRALMLESGIWGALRTRPFGNVPDPDGEPVAIFITAMESEILAPAPLPVINSFAAEFRAASNALAEISEATVYVCHATGSSPSVDTSERLLTVPFAEGHSSGLPGVHINALCPIGFGGREVWHIDYQDVISLGHLLLHGTAWMERVIRIDGPAVQNPRTLRVTPGASILQLLESDPFPGPVHILSGSALRGQVAVGSEAYLGARHRQITVLPEIDNNAKSSPQSTTGVLIPTDELEPLAPPGIYPVPFMRALQVGDVDRARDLGALELVEEDMAMLSFACVSKCDYGLLLRNVLNQLEGTG